MIFFKKNRSTSSFVPVTNRILSSLSLYPACEEGNQQLNSMPPLDENFTASLERKSVSTDASITCPTCKLEFAGNEAYQFLIHRSLCGQSPDGGMSNLRDKLSAANLGANSLNHNLNNLNLVNNHLNSNHQLNNHMNSNRAQSPAEPCSPKQRNSNSSSFFNQIGLNSDNSLVQQLSKAVGLFQQQQQSTSQQLQSLANQLSNGGQTGLPNGDPELNLIDKLPSADFNAVLSLLQQQQQQPTTPARLPVKSSNSLSSNNNNAFPNNKPNLSTNQQSSSLQKFNRMPGELFRESLIEI